MIKHVCMTFDENRLQGKPDITLKHICRLWSLCCWPKLNFAMGTVRMHNFCLILILICMHLNFTAPASQVQVLDRKKIQDLLREIDPRETMDDDVEEVISLKFLFDISLHLLFLPLIHISNVIFQTLTRSCRQVAHEKNQFWVYFELDIFLIHNFLNFFGSCCFKLLMTLLKILWVMPANLQNTASQTH